MPKKIDEPKSRTVGERRTVLTPEEMYEEVRIGNSVRRIKKQPTLSKYIREIIEANNSNQDDIAFVLGKDVRILRNKLYRGTFSLQDLCLIGEMFDFKLSLTKDNEEYILYADDICDEESVIRLREYKSNKKESEMKKLEDISIEANLEYISSDPERLKTYMEELSKLSKGIKE